MNTKSDRIDWLARVYSYDASAIDDEIANEQLYDRQNDFGLEHFLETFRPLQKLRKQLSDDISFSVGEVDHVADDLSFAEFLVAGEVCLTTRIRFEAESPFRIRYWGSYPPLPKGTEVRQYTPEDAVAIAELERACPMELGDGRKWIIDRGERFDDYLALMDAIDAAVVVQDGEVVGFYSCALRPIRANGSDGFCVYQHHYRVHPKARGGNVSHALVNFVDPRRTFESVGAEFPYSFVDPENPNMQNVGFPEANGVRVARLSINVSAVANAHALEQPSLEEICAVMNETHTDRVWFKPYDAHSLSNRLSRVDTYNLKSFFALGSSLLGVWQVEELNLLEDGEDVSETRLSFVLDYAVGEISEFETLLRSVAAELASKGSTTHITFLCDTRASEYQLLSSLADNEQHFAVHTLPWIIPQVEAGPMYCDGVYC